MRKNPVRAVIDTNVIISAIVFGGKPREIISRIVENRVEPVTSSVLLAELVEILVKKFDFKLEKITLVEELIKDHFIIVYPQDSLHVAADEDDNRVIEAAVKGRCEYSITGDHHLLNIGRYQEVLIVTPEEFLTIQTE